MPLKAPALPYQDEKMRQGYQFTRLELSGSLGDLGTLLPLAAGMVLVNGVSPVGIFYTVGFFYLFAGLYFGVPAPVQPMKAISAYAIATGVTATEVSASAALISVMLLIIGLSGAIDLIGRLIHKSVIRGVQLATGVLLATKGLQLILGNSPYQQQMGAAEPFFTYQALGPVPLSILFGIAAAAATLLLLQDKKYPAAMVVLSGGLFAGLLLGNASLGEIRPGIYLPDLLPSGLPSSADFTLAFFALVLPQIPMTVGNAIIANADLSKEYFGQESNKVTYRSTTLSMGLANGLAFFLGGIPLCHGAGGLAAHYKFGARTAGSNIIVGGFFLALAIFFGPQAMTLLHLLPLSILGVLLVFAGCQLGLAILDMFNRREMFVVLVILSITLATNLAWGFAVGLILAKLVKWQNIEV